MYVIKSASAKTFFETVNTPSETFSPVTKAVGFPEPACLSHTKLRPFELKAIISPFNSTKGVKTKLFVSQFGE